MDFSRTSASALLEIVRMGVSQINGCAQYLDNRSKDARGIGETELCLYVLPASRETTFYDGPERPCSNGPRLHADIRELSAGRGVCRGCANVQRERAGGSHARRYRDQRLEPPRDSVPCAGEATRRPGMSTGTEINHNAVSPLWNSLDPPMSTHNR